MSFTTIQTLLNTRLLTFSTANSIPVAWENKSYAPTAGTAYLRPTLLLAEPSAAALGTSADDYQEGIFQIDIMADDGDGWVSAYDIADDLRDQFARGTRLTYTDANITIQRVQVGPPLNDETRYQLPVSVHFYAFMDAA